jgi:endoglucanase
VDKRELLFKELTEAVGVPGHEAEVRAILRRHLEGITKITHDRLGSFVAKLPGQSDAPRVMLAGHMDEVGFMVRQISEDGFLRFLPLGGWWDQVILGQRMEVITQQGRILGVTGAKPPHLLDKEERNKMVEKKKMYLDVGASSKEEIEALGIRLGDPIVPVSPFSILSVAAKTYLAKAFDDRIGCALMLESLQYFAQEGHPNTLFGVGTVMEEVGTRGAKTSAHVVNPDVAIILEVDIAGDIPEVKPEDTEVKLGHGPTLLLYDARMLPNLHLRDLVIETAKAEGIPLQFSVMPGGATDGAPIHLHETGVPCVALGVPTRHIHSHSGIIRREDYDNTLKLLLALIKRLDQETVASFTA